MYDKEKDIIYDKMDSIVLREDKIIKQIYHISDIHIRINNDRYDEYNEVLENFCGKIRDEDSALIVVTGDILHSKSQITVQCVNELSIFFSKISRKCDVILTLGNHDIPNNSIIRKDNIIDVLLRKHRLKNNIYLLNENRTYVYGNIIFGNTVVYSEKVTECKIDTRKIKIALFHGIIKDNSIIGREGKVSLSDFKDYELGLFGDIHKHQFLDVNKTFGYSGSLIQQDYGEPVTGHGYIKWDLEKKRGKFEEIENSYCFHTLNINTANVLDVVKDMPNDLPMNVRLRVVYDGVSSEEMIMMMQSIQQKHKIVEYVTQEKEKIIILEDNNEKMTEFITFKDATSVIRLFESTFIKNGIDESDIKECLKILNDELSNVECNFNKGEINMHTLHLSELTYDNLFTYGKNNLINFNKFDKIVGLVSPNFTGKSSLIDSILYSIFEKSSRGSKTNCININKNKFSSRIKIQRDEKEYIISRSGNRSEEKKKDAKRKCKMSSRISIQEDNNMISCDDKMAYGKMIDESICDYDTFIDSTIMLQSNWGYVDMTEEERRKKIFTYLNLDVFRKICKDIKARYQKVHFYVKQLKQEYDDTVDFELDDKICYKTAEIQEYNKIIKTAKILEEKYQIILNKFSGIIRETDVDVVDMGDIDGVKMKLREMGDMNKRILGEINVCNEQIRYLEKNETVMKDMMGNVKDMFEGIFESIKTTKDNAKILIGDRRCTDTYEIEKVDEMIYENINRMKNYPEDLMIKYAISRDAIENEKELKEKIVRLNLKMNVLNERRDEMKDHKYNPKCEYCVNNTMTKEKIKNENEIMETEGEIRMLKNDVEKEKGKINQEYMDMHEGFEYDIEELQKLTETKIYLHGKQMMDIRKKNKMNIMNMREDFMDAYRYFVGLLGDKRNEKHILEGKLRNNENDMGMLRDIIIHYEELKLFEKIQEKKQEIQRDISQLRECIKDMSEKVVRSRIALDKYEEKKKENSRMLEKITQQDTLIKNYKNILMAYEKYNLMDEIMNDKVLPIIESDINNILMTITNFSIKIRYTGTGISIKRVINADSEVDAKLLSGFEHDILNILFKIVLNKKNVNVRSDFLIFDEILSSADEKHISKLEPLFDYIRKNYKWCLLITHLEALKNYFDMTLGIKRTENESQIIFQ